MGYIRIKKGLDLPLTGKPKQELSETKLPKRVALIGSDYVGLKPTMNVAEGDTVKLGDLLFTDKKIEGVKYTSPGSGKVIQINRGEKRVFNSLVIELSGNDENKFKSYSEKELSNLSVEQVKELLIDSGAWTALRTRPFSKVASPKNTPHSIFVTAMDTNPLAPSVEKILEGNENHFKNGLTVISKLTKGKVFLCKSKDAKIPTPDLTQLFVEEFDGPHPAGLVGTHIHFLDPVGRQKTVWHLNAQDVVAIGYLFTTGSIMTERIVALSGSAFKNPRLIKTRTGAAIADIVDGELNAGDNRVISGSVLSGYKAEGDFGYLGKYHQQVSAIPENKERVFFGWASLGSNLYSMKNVVISKLFPNKKIEFDTALNGGKRSIVPNGNFEAVIPLDIIPTYLFRAMAVNDVEEAEKLGLLELDEEDLALATFSCPSKLEYGPMLRENLSIIEKEG
ncbi:MAG: Na(+)-translocating NADH-quinone reductase subunit A [Ignavibacteriaceae bacterium]|jgi:Na+-transporting NADH:ubiquinone oxidoreductase subunit A|nr:Na(+)-translocating NADH-quinone reductase subunit A [Ignavibacteriaceae bacterium]